MGLDMYLGGRRLFMKGRMNEDGDPVSEERIELGYWRKHPNLHGYIVETFANGEDDCRPIELSQDDMVQIVNAIEDGKLPDTTGFFFGASDGSKEEKAYDLKVFQKAMEWALVNNKDEWRSVVYQASW